MSNFPDPVFPTALKLEVELDGEDNGWTELDDVLVGVSIVRGIPGTTLRDRVAATGTMSFSLDNSADNSAGLLGYYSPNNANCLDGWGVGIRVRYLVDYDNLVDEPLFFGKIRSITPASGKYRTRVVEVACVDWMEEAAVARVKGVALQINKRSDEVFEVLLDAVKRQPNAVFVFPGSDTYPIALDTALEEAVIMTELQRLAASEQGYIYVRRDGTLVFEGRARRPSRMTASITLDDSDVAEVGATRGVESIVNRAEIQSHPRKVDTAATSVLYKLESVPKIEAGTERVFRAPYRDPDQRATRTGGTGMVTPVAGTDFVFNVAADGSGANITAQLTLTVTFDANSAEVTIANAGPSDGYLTTLQLRGKGIYSYETVIATAESTASQDLYGEHVMRLDMPYQSDVPVAIDAAAYAVNQSKSILTPVNSVEFIANREDRLMRAALTFDVSTRVRVEETVIGTAPITPVGESLPVTPVEFFINGISIDIRERGIMVCTWTLAPGDPFKYWILERSGYTELGLTTRLAYGIFVAGWILGESQLGIDTRVNP